ncbi:MAG: hypothetical protein COU31_03175 [Candidatus Magasanikbacteria bacterium CG10_big_fil_rev_8_21_14_0_10_40_10]|uniref:Nucleotidyl transferase AbiEii/AbiGii toxin family protein n=1 Tax=Candidatus Magasanikbacteria bacterium CG10_big_fil_rev_8_21_14_0_10_40_10 TaxID=1974648 RepID=A0A2M6W3M8_9BACT|nr:MAG: hypothetical protein COU31_03175 [Candidatus Magasanikbacteria bacterium CG10_big_fil_rev_8_21_14_0_10_40_10]
MITREQFEIIKLESLRAGTPRGHERAILREYLQCEILSILSDLSGSEDFALIGGTGLRLLYDLDRFSEDLDFDTAHSEPMTIMEKIVATLTQRNYSVSLRVKNEGREHGGRIIFTDILWSLGLSPHNDESLMIKFEYTSPTPMPPITTRVLSRFGFVAQVVTEPLPALCARKAIALILRKRLQPRDIYDLGWFLSRRILPDGQTLEQFGSLTREALRAEISRVLNVSASQMRSYVQDVELLLTEPKKAEGITHVREIAEEAI